MAKKRQNILFVVCAYAIFWVILVGAFGLFSGNEELFPKVVAVVQVVGTWAPTFALLILFKKLYPGSTIREFYKNAFRERLNFKLLSVVTGVLLLVQAGFVGFAAFEKEVSFFSLLNFSFLGFVITLLSGATGEESGWRGHLQQSVEKNNGVLKSCLIVGVIWAFWHTPTWIDYVTSGRIYCIPMDILSKISVAFIIGICYNRCKNLFVPVWIHFVLNILANGTQGVLVEYYIWYVLSQVFLAIGYIVWYQRISKKETSRVKYP